MAALERAERTGDPSLLVGALIAVAWVRYQLGEGVQRELLERAIAAGPPLGFRTDQHPRTALAWQQFDSRQQIAEARTNFEAVLAEAEEAADAATYVLYFYLADVARWDNDWRQLQELRKTSDGGSDVVTYWSTDKAGMSKQRRRVRFTRSTPWRRRSHARPRRLGRASRSER
jgi:hypothetical protein